MPINSANTNPCTLELPNKKSANKVRSTVNDVDNERAIVCCSDASTTSPNATPGIKRKFSRMRSNTTIVS